MTCDEHVFDHPIEAIVPRERVRKDICWQGQQGKRPTKKHRERVIDAHVGCPAQYNFVKLNEQPISCCSRMYVVDDAITEKLYDVGLELLKGSSWWRGIHTSSSVGLFDSIY